MTQGLTPSFPPPPRGALELAHAESQLIFGVLYTWCVRILGIKKIVVAGQDRYKMCCFLSRLTSPFPSRLYFDATEGLDNHSVPNPFTTFAIKELSTAWWRHQTIPHLDISKSLSCLENEVSRISYVNTGPKPDPNPGQNGVKARKTEKTEHGGIVISLCTMHRPCKARGYKAMQSLRLIFYGLQP